MRAPSLGAVILVLGFESLDKFSFKGLQTPFDTAVMKAFALAVTNAACGGFGIRHISFSACKIKSAQRYRNRRACQRLSLDMSCPRCIPKLLVICLLYT